MTPARLGAVGACCALALSAPFIAVACDGGSAATPVHPLAATTDAETAEASPPADARADATDGGGDATPDALASVEAGPGISARGFHTCSMRGGTVKCWGANYFGELGNGTHTDQSSPTPVTVRGITGGVVHGLWHGCGFAGAVPSCWGANSNDELGHDQSLEIDGGAVDGAAGVWSMRPSSSVPAPLPGLGSAVAFALGDGYSCALSSQGTVSCWGADLSGVLGPSDGGTVCVGATGGPCSATPHAIPALAGVSQISAAESATACGLLADKTVWCWGDNQFGLLGQSAPDGGAIADMAPHPTPAQVQGLQGVTQIASGDTHRCALLSGGDVWCWGYNFVGQLGRDPAADPSCTALACTKTPAAVAGLANVREIGLGEGFGCALRTDDTVLCWGQNGAGQLGRDPSADGGAPGYTPQAVVGLANVAHIAVGASHACALKRDDSVVCWGDNGTGELGPGVDAGKTFTPVAVPGL